MALLHRHKMGAIDVLIVDAAPAGITAPIGSPVFQTNGDYWINTDGGTTYKKDVLGKDYLTVSSAARSTNATTAFVSKVQLDTGTLTGDYRIAWFAVIDSSATGLGGNPVEARLYNVTDAVVVGSPQSHQVFDAAERRVVYGFAPVPMAGVAKQFQIQWRQTGAGTAGIQEARIEWWRVF